MKPNTQDDEVGRRVYLSIHRFHAKGDLFVLPDGSTDLGIAYNTGSVNLYFL